MRVFYLLVAFTVGMCGMGIEMATARLLTPYFGSSLYTWANLIGVIMLCLTIGYAMGGYVAGKYVNEKLLYSILLIAGVYFSFIPCCASSVVIPMLHWITTSPVSFFLVSWTVNLLLLGIPFILIGMVMPYIIQLNFYRIEKLGQITGKIAVCSTLGSIVGTFIPVFWTMPFWGTKKTILYFGLLLMTMAMIGLFSTILQKSNTYQRATTT